MNDFTIQMQSLLDNLKKCYIERNKDNIKHLSKHLFHEDCPPIIIGTSNDEWCFGIEEAEKLFVSDWEGWGNVSIEIENAVYSNSGAYSWFYVPAGVEYSFEDSAETYAAFMEMTIEIAKGNKKPLPKAGEIIWLLSHLLHTRATDVRNYIWDMTISGVLENIEGWKIKTMQFSIPVLSPYSDVRTDADQDDASQYENECKKIFAYNALQKNNNDIHVKQLARLFDEDNKISFVSDDIRRYIGIDGVYRNGYEHNGYMNYFYKNDINVTLLSENIIFTKNKEYFTFCGVGLFSRNLSLDSDLNTIYSNIERYACMDDKKEALFRLRRDLSRALKESTLPNQLTEPFRIEGVGKIVQYGEMVVEYMQISYPFNCILEQKTDVAKII